MIDPIFKTRESRLRRAAQRQGLELKKNRRRDPFALDYGTYRLLDWRGSVVAGERLTFSDVAKILKGGPAPEARVE